jgi:hypothetical protein
MNLFDEFLQGQEKDESKTTLDEVFESCGLIASPSMALNNGHHPSVLASLAVIG